VCRCFADGRFGDADGGDGGGASDVVDGGIAEGSHDYGVGRGLVGDELSSDREDLVCGVASAASVWMRAGPVRAVMPCTW